MTTTLTKPPSSRPPSIVRRLVDEISPLEWIVAGVTAAVLLVLVLLEPKILEAPFENANTMIFTVGGTVIAAVVLVAMLWFKVNPVVRILVLGVPFVIVNWWLISPFFIDDVVDEEFETSIAAELGEADPAAATDSATSDDVAEAAPVEPDPPATEEPVASDEPPVEEPATEEPVAEDPVVEPSGPVLLGAGSFVGLAGHDGTGDAGIFQDGDAVVLRFENFDIQNGPDLEVYLVPGADQTSLADGSLHLGALKGNIGDQTYELPPGTELAPGAYTALVWCERFSVEFVGATVTI